MPPDFVPYEVALKLTSDDESYVLYQALNEYCSTIIRAHHAPEATIDSDDDALLLAAQHLAQQVHTAWEASDNTATAADGVPDHEQPL